VDTFNIILKKGQRFQLTFDRFECKDGEFILYDDNHYPSEEAYLSFDAVSAIVPTNQRHSDKIEPFRVYLTNDEHVDVYAHSFDRSQSPSIKFYLRVADNRPSQELKNIYVAASEVKAITPLEGLRFERKRSLKDD
jgi:hypothetical protein